MKKLSVIFSVLFAVWFLLFDQHRTIQTVGFLVESQKEYTSEELLASTEDNIFSNDTTSGENSTEVEESESSDDDIIELNIGGQRITTLRSTLTAVPNSKLALMFAKDNPNILKPRDKQKTIYFFDYNPVQFNYLLDQLRTIRRMPEIPAYEINIQAPNNDIPSNFSYMISDLGLNPERFLSPSTGAHLNLNISSLIGWRECYRNTYDTPFDLLTFIEMCRNRRLLVACHPINNTETLTLAGVGKWQDLFRVCSPNTQCMSEMKNGTGFYYAASQAWGFEGRPKELVSTNNGHNYNYYGHSQNSFYLNPCDSSDQYSEYRLCWSLRSDVNRGGGDRCGNVKNLHNAANWERIIFGTV